MRLQLVSTCRSSRTANALVLGARFLEVRILSAVLKESKTMKKALVITPNEKETEKALKDISEEFGWAGLVLSADIQYSLLLIRKPWIPIYCYPEGQKVIGPSKAKNGRYIKGLPAENCFRIVEMGLLIKIRQWLDRYIKSLQLPLLDHETRKPYSNPKLLMNGLQSFLSTYFYGSAIFIGRYFHSDKQILATRYSGNHRKLALFYNKWSPKIGKYLALQFGEIVYGSFSRHE